MTGPSLVGTDVGFPTMPTRPLAVGRVSHAFGSKELLAKFARLPVASE